MSTRKIHSVYDSKAQAYLQPFFSVTTGVAVRQFTAAVQDSNHDFHRFAEDYTLFELGDFNENTGKFSIAEPTAVLQASAVRELENGV